MKYNVTYRLKHPQFLPTTSVVQIDAHTHTELDARLVKVTTKWRAQGYTVQVLSVIPLRRRRTHNKW
ncbi:MAG TPA: hypothetical protein VKR06_39765 [Ktedonosporobacter sp.]|nr:hypothetical protein [Ktedonosporobacter sp.]